MSSQHLLQLLDGCTGVVDRALPTVTHCWWLLEDSSFDKEPLLLRKQSLLAQFTHASPPGYAWDSFLFLRSGDHVRMGWRLLLLLVHVRDPHKVLSSSDSHL